MNDLRFELRPWEIPAGATVNEVVPVIDGLSLIDRVAQYEAERGYEPSGGYRGVGSNYSAPFAEWFTGRHLRTPSPDHVPLLGCDCGEVECWPLVATVTVADLVVTWSRFRQPHREQWSYESFGPFTFDASDYGAQLARLDRMADARPADC